MIAAVLRVLLRVLLGFAAVPTMGAAVAAAWFYLGPYGALAVFVVVAVGIGVCAVPWPRVGERGA